MYNGGASPGSITECDKRMFNVIHQAKRVCGKFIPVLPLRTVPLRAVLLTSVLMAAVGCAPVSPVPNRITSTDTIGEVIIRYPDDWNDKAEISSVEGRQGVTLVRAERSQINATTDLNALPVVRITYDRRSETSLNDNMSLTEYAVRTISELWPQVSFEPPQIKQISARAAVSLEGIDSVRNLAYQVTLVDFISEDGILTAVLTAPGRVSAHTEAYDLMLQNTILTIHRALPTETPQPESTAELAGTSDVTADAAPETPEPDTTGIAPESSAEVQPPDFSPESTAELPPLSQDNEGVGLEPTTATSRDAEVEAEVEVTVEGTPDATNTHTDTGTAEADTGLITLVRGVQLQAPDGWTVSSNGQTSVSMVNGANTAEALLTAAALPTGEALLSVEIGTLEEVFRQPLTGFNLRRWFANELGSIVAQGGAAAQAGDIEDVTLDDDMLGIGALVTTPQYDRYIIVSELGGGMYKRIQLYTAPGEFDEYYPILLQTAASIELASR